MLGVSREKVIFEEVPHDDGTIRADPGVAGTVVHHPDLHVRAVGGVTNVHRVVQQDPPVPELSQLVTNSVEPIRPHGVKIRKYQAGVQPLRFEFGSRPEDEVMVLVAGGPKMITVCCEAGCDLARHVVPRSDTEPAVTGDNTPLVSGCPKSDVTRGSRCSC